MPSVRDIILAASALPSGNSVRNHLRSLEQASYTTPDIIVEKKEVVRAKEFAMALNAKSVVKSNSVNEINAALSRLSKATGLSLVEQNETKLRIAKLESMVDKMAKNGNI